MDNKKTNQVIEPASFDSGESISPLKFEPLSGEDTPASYTIRRGTALVIVSLLICVAIATFLFIARAVYIETTPSYAEVDIQSILKLKLADRHLLLSADHQLSLKAEGYYNLKETLVVGKKQDQHHYYEMQRLPGHLQISTDPVMGAEIFIDDVSVGHTPVLVRDIKPGERQLRLIADRYFPLEQSVEIEGLDKEQQLEAKLIPAWAEVTVATNPPGAGIFVDDELLGQTPRTLEILEGKHKIRVKLGGYKLWQEDINIIAKKAVDFQDIELELADAVVFLASDPPRASATVNGEYKGLTPLELALTPGKESSIRLFKQGYKSANRKVQVKSGEEKRLVVKLAAELVDVEFNITPNDARLFINGRAQNDSNVTLQLPAKTHRIEVRREGFVSYKTKITPHTDIPQQVNVKLKSERQAQIERIKPVYTNSAGQSLKLFYPTAFTMGASRREPGRRANETIRDIELKRPFYMGLHEVTNEQFKKFAKDHVSGTVQGKSLNGDNLPAANMAWEQAAKYCNWLSKAESLTPFYKEEGNSISGVNPSSNGYRLPTEAEWAWAARTKGKGESLKFPWGDAMPPPAQSGNYADNSVSGFLGKVIAGYNDGYLASSSVGKFNANSKGLFDMGGNVAEWTHDFYDIQLGTPNKPPVDPLGPVTGKFHVIRGSSWAHGTVTELRLSYRDYHAKSRDDVGFRIARYLE